MMNTLGDVIPRPTPSWIEVPEDLDDLFPVGRGEDQDTVGIVDTGFEGRLTYVSRNRPLIGADSWSRAGVLITFEEGSAASSDRSLSLTRQHAFPRVYRETGIRDVDFADQGDVTLFDESDDEEEEAVVGEFAQGVSGFPVPAKGAVDVARRLVRIAASYVEEPEISVDIDGELSFDLRCDDGNLVFAELAVDGRLDVGVYDEKNDMVLHDTRATVTLFNRAVAGGSLL